MKTDDLIALLSTGLEPVQTGAARQRLQWAVLGGLAGGTVGGGLLGSLLGGDNE